MMNKLLEFLLKRDRTLSLVYVSKDGVVTYSKSIIKERLHDIRGIMLNNEIELEVRAEPFMTYKKSQSKALAKGAELLSVEYKDLYYKSCKSFNNLIYELICAGLVAAVPLRHCDPVWCKEHDDECAKGFEFSNEIHQGNYFQHFPAWCRLQHKH